MENKSDFITRLLNQKSTSFAQTINDLRDKEFSGIKLSPEEQLALDNFDKYRLQVLNSETDEEKFHHRYRQLQVIANLGDWREFVNREF